MKDTNLQQNQIELLYDARRIERDGGEPVVVSQDSVDAVREALAAPLSEIGMSDNALDAMPIGALAAAVTPDDEQDEDAAGPLLALQQHPETGGAPDEPDDEPEGIDALSADERADVKDKLEVAARMESRTPRYANDLRKEAAAMIPGVDDPDELDDLDLGN